jgi:SpoVK/Ycf46/Vps4 family AAA+-type ATPase
VIISKGWTDRNDKIYPTSSFSEKLAPGFYSIANGAMGPYLERETLETDELIVVAGGPADKILSLASDFFKRSEEYAKLKLVHKYSVLLHGNPGSGKTCIVEMIGKRFIADGGIVLIIESPYIVQDAIKEIRSVEPDRKIMCIIEEIDEMISGTSEGDLASVLDGEAQAGGVFFISTTNHPERLSERILRHGRIDDIFEIGMPSQEMRESFFVQKDLFHDEAMAKDYAENTVGMSMSQLREIIILTQIRGIPLEDAVKSMSTLRISCSKDDAQSPSCALDTALGELAAA